MAMSSHLGPLALGTGTFLSGVAIWKRDTRGVICTAAIVALFGVSYFNLECFKRLNIDLYLARCFHIIFLAHIINVLHIEQLDLRSTGSTSFLTACRVLQNPRWLTAATRRREVRLSEYFTFCTRTMVRLGGCYLLKECLRHLSPRGMVVWSDIHPAKESMIRRLPHITSRELQIRLALTISGAPVKQLELAMWHKVLALFFVATRLEDPDEWQQPLYGSLSEAYSMRRFWGIFEHRLAYYSYRGIVRSVLNIGGCPRRGLAQRLLSNGVVFGLSALVHALVAWQSGNCEPWLDAQYYCMSFFAILVEETFCAVMQVMRLEPPVDMVRKLCGYSWVFLFHYWISAKIAFPEWRCGAVYEY